VLFKLNLCTDNLWEYNLEVILLNTDENSIG